MLGDHTRAPTVVVVSDLHMAAGRHDPFADDAALVAWLDALARRSAAGERLRLVLLGDTFDFTLVEHRGRRLEPTPAGALARLELIAAAHRETFAALARAARAGVALDIVAGNHDLELLFAAVGERLRALVAADGECLRVHPWLLYLPGLAYLEHGQQHHDINHVPRLLEAGAGTRIPPPAGTLVGECRLRLADSLARPSVGGLRAAARRRPARIAPALAALVTGARGLAHAERAARRARRSAGATAERRSTELGLPPALAAELERTAAALPSAALRRLAAAPPREPYLVAAARGVHELLAGAGHAVGYYVFAHTHVAEDRPLTADSEGPRYLNAGTWSRVAPSGAQRRCHVELRDGTGGPSARLVRWEEEAIA